MKDISKGKSDKPIVAHVIIEYLPLTEQWLYQYIKNHSLFKPIVLTDWTQNLDKFPFEPMYSAHDHPIEPIKRFNRRWFWKNFREKIFGLDTHKLSFHEMKFYQKTLLNSSVNLLHAHFGPTGVLMLPLKRKLELPLVTTFYGYDMSRLIKLEYWRDRYKKLFDEGDIFLVEGEYMRNKLIESGCAENKVSVQRIALELGRYKFVPRSLSDPKDIIKVLICASFREKKGIPYAIKAFDITRKIYPNINLRIIGDGELRSEIEALIIQLGLKNHVSLLGFLSHSEYINELENTHIFMAPSVTSSDGDSEGGAPTVLLEAQACGIPVLSTYHADIPNVVVDGKSGFLVPERDAEALAEKLIYLIKNHEEWAKIGQSGRKNIEEKHNMSSEINNLESKYMSLMVK